MLGIGVNGHIQRHAQTRTQPSLHAHMNTDSPEQDSLISYFLGVVFPPKVLVNLLDAMKSDIPFDKVDSMIIYV